MRPRGGPSRGVGAHRACLKPHRRGRCQRRSCPRTACCKVIQNPCATQRAVGRVVRNPTNGGRVVASMVGGAGPGRIVNGYDCTAAVT
eukprot:3486545-Pyramimonas_sp.AAC.1